MLFQQPVELGVKRMARGFRQGMGRHPDFMLLTFPTFAYLIDITGLLGIGSFFWNLS